MSKIIKITTFFLFFIMCFCLQNVIAAVTGPLIQVETCSTVGAKQTKYTFDGVCSYTSQTRECCGLSWSPWGGKCCSNSNKPITSQSCKTSAGYAGTQTRTVTCNTSNGTWTTGSWGTCVATAVCTSGETRECPTNPWQIQTCTPAGQWGSCTCANVGNGKVYCEGMPRKAGERCYNGGWAMDSCSGICCCSGSKPYFFKAVGGPYKGYEVAGCKSTTSPYEITYSCMCTYQDGSTGDFELMPNL